MSDTSLYVQSEVTGQGPFAHKVMAARKNLAMRNINKNKTYPNVVDENLGTVPGEILVYFKHDERNKKQSVAVFSAFNGHYWGRVGNLELNKRLFSFAGICKTKKEISSGGNSPFTNDNFLAWVESGHVTLLCNSGDRMIPAGSLVYLDMPPTPYENPERYINSSTAPAGNRGRGVPKAKYTMITKPFDPCEFSAQIDALAYLFNVSKANGGISDMDFSELYDSQPGFTSMKKLSDMQQASGALLYGIIGIYSLYIGKIQRGEQNPKILAQYTLLQNCGNLSLAKANMAEFYDEHKNAFDNNKLKPLNSTNQAPKEVKNAYMERDAITNLFGAFGQMAAEKNRWVIGVCTKDSDIGEPLDVNIRVGTRPYSM
jgi:hypothetical protein